MGFSQCFHHTFIDPYKLPPSVDFWLQASGPSKERGNAVALAETNNDGAKLELQASRPTLPYECCEPFRIPGPVLPATRASVEG